MFLRALEACLSQHSIPRASTVRCAVATPQRQFGEALLTGTFESAELAFVERFLKPGMTMLDLGAHHGLYTLLASKRVAPGGKVFAFEPSPRERRALHLNALLNLCWNVTIQGLALGSENTRANLFVVEGSQTGCNTLRPPDVLCGTSPVRVRVTRLDDWLDSQRINQVDFIKLDVEGAELDVLMAAERLLNRTPRPVILAEVQACSDTAVGLSGQEDNPTSKLQGYQWLCLKENGSPERLELGADDPKAILSQFRRNAWVKSWR